MDALCVDLRKLPIVTAKQNEWALIMCYSSIRSIEIVPLKEISAEQVARVIHQTSLLRYGIPQVMYFHNLPSGTIDRLNTIMEQSYSKENVATWDNIATTIPITQGEFNEWTGMNLIGDCFMLYIEPHALYWDEDVDQCVVIFRQYLYYLLQTNKHAPAWLDQELALTY